jgi:5S rRNA maturation endonuclease (ribonuclease M5)
VRPIERVLERLGGVEERNGKYMALCSSHNDHEASLSITEGDDGRVLLHCFAGCSLDEILGALGLRRADLFERNSHRKPSAIWQIKDAAGEVQAVHIRFDRDGDKQVLWRLPGAQEWGLEGRKLSTLPLYRSEHVRDWPEDMLVIVVEGEKAADALASVYPAVLGTVTGAESTPVPESLQVLRGRRVILWPDADDEGFQHMQRFAERLQGIASDVRIFEWREAPPKGDAADHPAVLSRSRQSVRALLEQMASTLVWEPGSSSSSSLPYRENDDDDATLGLLWFSEMGEPKPREFLVEDLLPKCYPATIFGTGGVAKSMLALLLGMSYAGGMDRWLGLRVNGEGAVLYFDHELDADEQLRRVRDLCAGLGVNVPDKLGYLSALGKGSEAAFEAALSICQRHDVQLLILDSLGPAMIGDAGKARDVIAFHNKFIAPFRAMGVTTLIVDHQGKVQSGEQYQSKTALGSAYKGHLVRSAIQVEAVRREKEAGTLTVRLRQNKTNFGGHRDPFDVLLTFRQGKITAEPVEIDATELAGETTLNADDRVLLALNAGAAFPDELAGRTDLAVGTVGNCLTRLRKRGEVEDTGQVKGRARQVRLSSSSSSSDRDNDDDDAVERAAREDEELLRTGLIQSERQVFELVREHSMNS